MMTAAPKDDLMVYTMVYMTAHLKAEQKDVPMAVQMVLHSGTEKVVPMAQKMVNKKDFVMAEQKVEQKDAVRVFQME